MIQHGPTLFVIVTRYQRLAFVARKILFKLNVLLASSGTGNEILWDKAFRHDMRSKSGSPRILFLLPVPLLDNGNEGSDLGTRLARIRLVQK